jgi:hypothetical protein
MGSSSPSPRFKCQPATSKNDKRKRRETASEHPPAKNIQHDSTESLRVLLRVTRITELREILKIAAKGKSRIGFRQKMTKNVASDACYLAMRAKDVRRKLLALAKTVNHIIIR